MSTSTPDHTRGAVDLYNSPNALEALIAQNAATEQLLSAHERLVRLIEKLETPATIETVVLTPSVPTWESRERFTAPVKSLGLLNPNSINIYFSGVGSAAVNMRSPSAPPNSLIVLPISAQFVEVAANPTDLSTNTAICFLLRYQTVQPAFLGKGA